MPSFDNIVAAFRSELDLWPPNEQSFEVSLSKTFTHGFGGKRTPLGARQKEILQEIYDEVRSANLIKAQQQKMP